MIHAEEFTLFARELERLLKELEKCNDQIVRNSIQQDILLLRNVIILYSES